MPRAGVVEANQTLPWRISAESVLERPSTSRAADLAAWYQAHEAEIAERLLMHGAVLFRGFGVDTPAAFAEVAKTLCPEPMEGLEENVPRTKLSAGVYTSTEMPATERLSMHSEYSYSHLWPAKLAFCCIVPPVAGGETPIADNRAILRQLDPAVVDAFTRKRVTYVRNLPGRRGFGLSWQTSFQTEDPAVVEAYCQRASIACEWKADGGLRLTQTSAGIIRHPKTNELVWFNQAPQFHISDYPEEIYRDMLEAFTGREADLPQDVFFEDGTRMDASMLQHVRDTMHGQAVLFPWLRGDVLLIDNLLCSHGRMPFSGPRKILVAMSRS